MHQLSADRQMLMVMMAAQIQHVLYHVCIPPYYLVSIHSFISDATEGLL